MINDLHDAKLIEEQLTYEENFFKTASIDIEKSMELEYQIANYLEEFFEYSFEYEYYDDDFPELNSELYSDFEFKQALKERLNEYKQDLDNIEIEFNDVEVIEEQFHEDNLLEIIEFNDYSINPLDEELLRDYDKQNQEYEINEKARDEILIKEYLNYENFFIESSLGDIEKTEEFNHQISSYENEEYFPEEFYYY